MWLRRLWQTLTGRRRRREREGRPPEPPGEEPALVPTGPPRRPRPAGAVELELPHDDEFDDHARHPRSDE